MSSLVSILPQIGGPPCGSTITGESGSGHNRRSGRSRRSIGLHFGGSSASRTAMAAAPATNSAQGNESDASSDDSMRARRISCFDASQMPETSICKREMHSFSVHHSPSTSKWIATIVRPTIVDQTVPSSETTGSGGRQRYASFSFNSQREANNFAKAYSPPKMMVNKTQCCVCDKPFDRRLRSHSCRNCGVAVCDKCSARWGVKMIPRTYLPAMSSLTVRVCTSCDWLSNAFCMALLQGRYENAVKFYESGNVNIRCSFADINKEAMFPIHCAVMGGNLKIVKWLIETLECPYSVRRDIRTNALQSVQTSANRTLIDLAMTGKPKIDILSYLVKKNLSVLDTKDPNLAPQTLELLMKAGFRFDLVADDEEPSTAYESIDMCESSVGTGIEDACILCCEQQMDCVLTPCGHQICCSRCGDNLRKCPICKNECTPLRIFRM